MCVGIALAQIGQFGNFDGQLIVEGSCTANGIQPTFDGFLLFLVTLGFWAVEPQLGQGP